MAAGSGIALAAVFVVAALALSNDTGADADADAGADADASADTDADASADAGADAGGLPVCTDTTSVETTSGTAQQPAASSLDDVTRDCELHEDQGDDEAISALQSALVTCHGQAIAVDGEFGAATEQAVTAVQAQLGISADGVYGPVTRQSMQWPVTSAAGETSCVAIGT